MSQAGPLNKGGGSGAAPIETLTGDTGGPVPPTAFNVNVKAGNSTQNAGSSVLIAGNPGTSTLTLNVTDVNSNTIIGETAGNATITGTDNTGLGETVLRALTTGIRNTGVGFQALNTLQNGNFNVAVGYNALLTMLSGGANTAVGTQALTSVNTGLFNTALGYQAGFNYTTNESSNIVVANPGVIGESNTLRIGVTGNGTEMVNRAFIAGIDGVDVGSVARVVTEASDQLGTAIITAGTGITVTPGPNTITIASTAGSFTWSNKSADFNALPQNGYFITGTCIATLPAAPAIGDTIEFFVQGNFTLTIQANAGQTIQFATNVSTVAGTQSNTMSGDACELVYNSTGTNWACVDFVGAWNFT